ncbi:hypothetical protein JW826_04515 [Candidatus Woesearchaeota archaeon]|nr:hypothetical protein [Candidatus Woesearchaeota archaeon]
MKATILSSVAIALLLVAGTSAMTMGPSALDTTCEDNFFPGWYGIAQWTYTNDTYTLVESNPAYTTTVEGDATSANWTSSAPVAQILVQAETGESKVSGNYGTERAVEEEGIQALTLCSHPDGKRRLSVQNAVPEFSMLTLGAAVVVSLLGVLYLRKQ